MDVYVWSFLGFTQYFSRVLNSTHDISYKEFYTKFYYWMKDNPNSFLGKEMIITKDTLTKVLNKEELWGRKIEETTGDYYWDYEEATSIKIVTNQEQFDENIRSFILQEFKYIDSNLLENLLLFQKNICSSPFTQYPKKESFDFNLNEVIFQNKPIKNGGYTYEFDSKNYDSDVKKWCTINMWWGRRNRGYEAQVTNV